MTLQLRTDDLDWRQIDDEIVALHGGESKYLAVNGSGVLLWQALASGTSHENLVSTLVETYGIDEARAQADVKTFLVDLAEHDLLSA
jgi:hypothetical protein